MSKYTQLHAMSLNLIRTLEAFRLFLSTEKEPAFLEYLRCYKKSGQKLLLQSLGPQNPGKVIYISNCSSPTGFFAQHRTLLQSLAFADHYGMLPVVDYRKDFTYAEREPVNGSWNPFEYYFRQPTSISLDSAQNSRMVVFYAPSHQLHRSKGYLISDKEIEELAYIQRKYIRLNPVIEPVLHESIQQLLQHRKTLGVHIRGTDFNRQFDNHPKVIPVSRYFKYIDEALQKHNFEQIFLATDDKRIVQQFLKKYPSKTLFYQHTRNDSDVSVAFNHTGQKLEHYTLGYEVLLDMMTLASCDGLIAGPSQVSFAARIEKKSREQEYEYLQTVFNGINKETGNISYFAPERLQFQKHLIKGGDLIHEQPDQKKKCNCMGNRQRFSKAKKSASDTI